MDDENIADQESHTTVLKNEYLFKNYLLVKILNSNLKTMDLVQEKILLQLINSLLDKKAQCSNHDLIQLQEIFNCLYLMCSKYCSGFSLNEQDIDDAMVLNKLNSLLDQSDLVKPNFLSSLKKILRPTVDKICQLFNLKKGVCFSAESWQRLDDLVVTIIEKLVLICEPSENLELQIVVKDLGFLLDYIRNINLEILEKQPKEFRSKSCITIIGTDLKRKLSSSDETNVLTSSSSSISILKYKKIRRLSNTSIPSITSSNSLVISEAKKARKTMNNNIDLVSKLFPLSLSVNKLPGIGKVYAQRLKEHKISSLGDLVQLYQVKCNRNKTKFTTSIKYMTFMKTDTVTKLIRIMQTVLKNER